MKYVTHLTVAAEDDKHEDLRERMGGGVSGLAAYGAYWMVLEKIGAQIRPESVSTSMTKTVSKWSEIAGVKTSWFRKWSRAAHEAGLILLSENGNKITIGTPNILKYADEYSRRVGIISRQTPDKLPRVSGTPALPALQEDIDLRARARTEKKNPEPETCNHRWTPSGVCMKCCALREEHKNTSPTEKETVSNNSIPPQIKELHLDPGKEKPLAELYVIHLNQRIPKEILANQLLACGLDSAEIVRAAQVFLGSVGKDL